MWHKYIYIYASTCIHIREFLCEEYVEASIEQWQACAYLFDWVLIYKDSFASVLMAIDFTPRVLQEIFF